LMLAAKKLKELFRGLCVGQEENRGLDSRDQRGGDKISCVLMGTFSYVFG
jgi:hypothetical protein